MPQALSETDMGRDMLVEDYLLKQLAASLSYPEENLGRAFWGEVYQQLVGRFGSAAVDMSSLNKVWIVPGEAEVYVNGNTAIITGARLKLMLANDYAAAGLAAGTGGRGPVSAESAAAEAAAREILIPVLEKEVNEGKTFSQLRQIYHALLLALWARKHLSGPVWHEQYIGRNRIGGINLDDTHLREKVYSRYLESFKQGVYNYIREQEDPVTHDMTPQKYFSGGLDFAQLDSAEERNDSATRSKAAARMGALQSKDRLMAVASAVSPARNGQAKSAPTNLIYKGATWESGRIVGGELVNAEGAARKEGIAPLLRREAGGFTGVVDNVPLAASGGLKFNGEEFWSKRKGYENALVTILMESGKVTRIYDKQARLLYPHSGYYIYEGGSYEAGRVIDGKPLTAGGLADSHTFKQWLSRHPMFTGTVIRARLSARGGLDDMNGKTLWTSLVGYEGAEVDIEFLNGAILAVHGAKGRQLYPFKEGFVYQDAQYENKKAVGGRLLNPHGAGSRGGVFKLLQSVSNFTGVVLGFRLDNRGGLPEMNGKVYWDSLPGKENVLVDLVLKDGLVVAAYDETGARLYPFGEHYVYPGINYQQFRSGGVIPLTPGGTRDRKACNIIIQNAGKFTGIIDQVRLTDKGVLKKFAGLPYLKVASQGPSALVAVEMVEGKVAAIYASDGQKLFPAAENVVYINAVRRNGQIVDGVMWGNGGLATRQALNMFLKEHAGFNGVIKGVRLDPDGSLRYFNGKDSYWRERPGYEGALVDIVMRNGAVVEAYGPAGELLYGASYQNMIYEGAVDRHASIMGGRLAGSVIGTDRMGLNMFLKDSPHFSGIIDNVLLGEDGSLQGFNGRDYWYARSDYKNAMVRVVMSDGDIVTVYTLDGEKIYPFMENYAYVGGVLVNGQIEGGTLLNYGGAMTRYALNRFLRKHSDLTGFIRNVRVGAGGVLGKLGDKEYPWLLKGFENALITVELVKGKVRRIFDEHGGLIRSVNDHDKVAHVVDRLIESGDMDKMLDFFGEEGINRFLFNMLGNINPLEIVKFTRGYLRLTSGKRKNMKRSLVKKKSLPEFLDGIDNIQLFSSTMPQEIAQVLSQEMFRALYGYIVADHKMLDVCKERVKRGLGHPVFRHVLGEIVQEFDSVSDFKIQGFKSGLHLKFYQKIGIKRIVEQKRALLADLPGLGKTIQALGAVLASFDGKGADKVLIVCPKVASGEVWAAQIETHLAGEQRTYIIKSINDVDSPVKLRKLKEARFVIVNYELLRGESARKLRDALHAMAFDFIIADEAHRMRNDSQVTEAVKEFDAEYKLLLSASAQKGRTLGKIFNLLHWLYPERYPQRRAFLARYNNAAGFRELKFEMRDFTIRRNLQPDIPNLSVEYRVLQMKDAQARLYRKIEEALWERIKQGRAGGYLLSIFQILTRVAIDTSLVPQVLVEDMENGVSQEVDIPGVTTVVLAGRSYRILPRTDGDSVALMDIDDPTESLPVVKLVDGKAEIDLDGKKFRIEMRPRESASVKYEELDRIVDEVVAGRQSKLVMFSGMLPVVNSLAARYAARGIKTVTVTGAVSDARRNSILRDFNASDTPMILIATYQTLGESVDLTGCHDGVLVDSPWQDRDQIYKRLARIGQVNEVRFLILQALNTIDERIEQVNWEADMIQKLVLDDIGAFYQSQHELMRLYTEANARTKYERTFFDKLRQKMVRPNARPTARTESTTSDGRYFISLEGDHLEVRLVGKDGQPLEMHGMSDMMENIHKIDDESRGVFKDFIVKRLAEEAGPQVRIKDTILWRMLSAAVPGFRDIDYDGHLETIVELGRYILQRLIENPDMPKEEILDGLGEIPERLYEQTMYYLDSANIFKLLSLIGLIPPSYYYNGQLLKYDSPLRIFYMNGSVQYFDRQIVDKIAPDWRVLDKDISAKATGLSRDGYRVRNLTEAEERRLANQVRLGNKAAEDVLVGAHIKEVVKVAAWAVQHVNRVMSIRNGDLLQKEDLYGEGNLALVELIRIFSKNEIYENTALSSYLSKRLNARIFSLAFARGREVFSTSPDGPAYKDSDMLISDIYGEKGEAVTPMLMMAQGETFSAFNSLLAQAGFQSQEAELLSLFVFEGYTEEELAEETASKEARPVQKADLDGVNSLVAEFRSRMSQLGKEAVMSTLGMGVGPGDADWAMATPGGIDMRPETLAGKPGLNAEDGGDVADKHERTVLTDNFSGFHPVVLRIAPLVDWQMLLN
ncbi:MAG: DEAD/DEAH box helicase [Candidatus Omnitrophica bacterium]|nr:DEAD/DEAH box helicase [Candidatus Omnitrophota bacterium]